MSSAGSEDEAGRTAKEEESGDMRKSNRCRSCRKGTESQGTRTSDDILIFLSISSKRFCGLRHSSPTNKPMYNGLQW